MIDAPVATSPSGKISTNKPDFKVANGALRAPPASFYHLNVETPKLQLDGCGRLRMPERQRLTSMTLGEFP